eukprot:scaffold35477_cov43-Cyclotella_meneghiniana.AAC.12
MVGGSGERVHSGIMEKLRLLMRMCLRIEGEGRWKRSEGVLLIDAFAAKVFLRRPGNELVLFESFLRVLLIPQFERSFVHLRICDRLVTGVCVSEHKGKEITVRPEECIIAISNLLPLILSP